MKSIFNGINGLAKALVACAAMLSTMSFVSGQSMPQINARFANPHFDEATRMYYLDVELNSKISTEYLFGMNVRFFYDATMLEFKTFDQFSSGYAQAGESPRSLPANGQAGSQMFSLKEATVFVNGAVQLVDNQTALKLTPEKWTKAFRACFKVPSIHTDKKDFCPSVIWDTKGDNGRGGFLVGDDGLVITVVDTDPNTPEDSAPSHVSASYFNWEFESAGEMPYGRPASYNCVTLSEITATQDHGFNEKGFALYQNEPNPFTRNTAIQFVLPAPQHVDLKFYDVSGKQIDVVSGEYKEGTNVVNLDKRAWMEESKVVFYRMETDGFKSNTLKMVLINE